MTAIKIGLVGFGKIARDQHVPAISAVPGIDLIATAGRTNHAPGLPAYQDIEAMIAGEPDMNAVALCQPPHVRFAAARTAVLAGKHVFLEKPPGATVSEVHALAQLAQQQGVTLYTSWHSRHASGVAAARAWVAHRPIDSVRVIWKEDVRHWHPGQTWIWQAGGFGVFDPGINALSILTEILPERLRVAKAHFETPANCQAPIAATLSLETESGVPVSAEFDFRQTAPQSWDIMVTSGQSLLCLSNGGNALAIDGVGIDLPAEQEYPSLYREFINLVQSGRSLVDVTPLQIVADAFLIGHNSITDAFYD